MAAFLLLPTESGITLADVESWVERARTLGASAISPVRVGASPLAAGGEGGVTLSVPVTVTRRILSVANAASYRSETRADHERDPETEVDGVSVSDGTGQTAVEESHPAQRPSNVLPRPPLPVFSHPS
ncbi:hypothetical protein GCM10023317_72180 [Actinopolymorpha pittospori]